MSEIRKWLEGIGLVQYADIFSRTISISICCGRLTTKF